MKSSPSVDLNNSWFPIPVGILARDYCELARVAVQAIIKAFGITDNDRFIACAKASDGFRIGEWYFRFSGRTQRDAISNGELPWIVDIAKQVAA